MALKFLQLSTTTKLISQLHFSIKIFNYKTFFPRHSPWLTYTLTHSFTTLSTACFIDGKNSFRWLLVKINFPNFFFFFALPCSTIFIVKERNKNTFARESIKIEWKLFPFDDYLKIICHDATKYECSSFLLPFHLKFLW